MSMLTNCLYKLNAHIGFYFLPFWLQTKHEEVTYVFRTNYKIPIREWGDPLCPIHEWSNKSTVDCCILLCITN